MFTLFQATGGKYEIPPSEQLVLDVSKLWILLEIATTILSSPCTWFSVENWWSNDVDSVSGCWGVNTKFQFRRGQSWMFQSFGYCRRLLRRFFQALVRGFSLRIGGVMMLTLFQATGG
ncbi:hypothetical protein GALMADRAFT_761973 [Galerina marginata CBS 339.88]|uniref:Uncharacterized protein n=1 Tax=Galerina marginata (strain CBS 339.88) TaxID=685588 RepID=A0A067SP31_GALM3|nr:hypothetical protein GALMADRAFT_761973 [Galerina marginata CBS 339.88]